MTFEELVATLEELTERMASGQIGIEEAADLYEQAELLHGLAAERLARVQARIEAHAAGPDGQPKRRVASAALPTSGRGPGRYRSGQGWVKHRCPRVPGDHRPHTPPRAQ